MKRFAAIVIFSAVTATAPHCETHEQRALSPFGALVNASEDGKVSAWPVAPELDLTADTVSVTISAENIERHRDDLPDGLAALIERYPNTFTINVYPSRRTHRAPTWIDQSTLEQHGKASLHPDGAGFSGVQAAIPFRQPSSGLEVYWNHIARWRGSDLMANSQEVRVYADGRPTRIKRQTVFKSDYYQREPSQRQGSDEGTLFSLLSRTVAPARLSGQGALVIEPLDQQSSGRRAWLWDNSRRRALRAPKLAFDNPVGSSDGLQLADEVDIINGDPTRYEWRLLGQKALIVPYNNHQLANRADDDALLQAGHLAPQALRYEYHRVWIIEARLKDGWRHPYQRRVIYVDEDSWSALLSESYDSDDQLWRVGVNYSRLVRDVPAILPAAYVFHDLLSGRYHVQGLTDSEDLQVPDKPISGNRFTPQGLRRFLR